MLRLPGLLPVGVLLLPLACFLILSINVLVSPDLYWYDQQRIGQVAVLVATALSCMACIVLGRGAVSFGRPSPLILVAVAIVFMLGALSAARSEHVLDAALEWSRFLLIGFLAWTVGNCARTFPGTTSLLLLGALVTACLWFLGARLGPYMAILALDLPLSGTAFLAGFDNPRFFGQMQTMTLPLLMLPLVLPGLSRRIRLAAAAFLVAWWMLAWLSGTRGTLYALLATAAAASIVFGGRGRAYALASAGFAAAGAVCYGFFFAVLPGWLGTPVDGTGFARSAFGLSSREELWRLSVEYLYEHPLLGIGPMQFAAAASPIGAHPHSIPLQLVVEWGLPAAIIAMAGMALAVVARAWQHHRQRRRRPAAGTANRAPPGAAAASESRESNRAVRRQADPAARIARQFAEPIDGPIEGPIAERSPLDQQAATANRPTQRPVRRWGAAEPGTPDDRAMAGLQAAAPPGPPAGTTGLPPPRGRGSPPPPESSHRAAPSPAPAAGAAASPRPDRHRGTKPPGCEMRGHN